MAFKAVAFCASVLLVQITYGQIAQAGLGAQWGCAGAPWGLAAPGLGSPVLGGAGLAGPGLGLGCGCGVASSGGGFPVTSASPIVPTGVTVVSENVYEGSLAASGNLPMLGTVALEGVLPTAGAGAVSYGCGDGAVGIAVEEGPVLTGIASSAPALGLGLANGLGYNGLGYGGIGYGPGCGCGVY